VIKHAAFAVEPWVFRETTLDVDVLAQTGSLFALANGHLGMRATLDEGEPSSLPGTYLNGFYESGPPSSGESAFGRPDAEDSMVSVANGTIMRLRVEGEPFDVRVGELVRHERTLDFRAGVLRREVEWVSPMGRRVRVSSSRIVSLVHRALAGLLYEVEPLSDATRLEIQSELVANEPTPIGSSDPRTGASMDSPLRPEQFSARDARIVLVHSTRVSGLRVAAGMDHSVQGPSCIDMDTAEINKDTGRVTISADIKPGQKMRVVKLLAYGWSGEHSAPVLECRVAAALDEARRFGWNALITSQRTYLDEFWQRADVEVEGDRELQQAVRFALFHTLQATARSEQGPIAAKGLTGPGYSGHTFWDTEMFVLPMLTYTTPGAARDALRWRHSTLGPARKRARMLGLAGAAFPWRTITGYECSSYWPAGTAAFHVAADIAHAVARYHAAAEDDDVFEHEAGLELLIETARLWRALGHHDGEGRFCIDGVTGPDEYSAIANNNIYTNVMAQLNLRSAADAVERDPDRATDLGVDSREAAAWRDAASAMFIPYDAKLRVHPQAEGFTAQQVWNFAATAPDQYPLMLHVPYFDLYRKQVVKQADLMLALHLRGDAFSQEAKARDFAYYEPLTVRDSSLSACTQAVIAAEVGHLELAYDYFGESALIDLEDLARNTRDGLHIASLAGVWMVAVAGFGGMRDHAGSLSFAPRLPVRLSRLAFCLAFRGRRLKVEISPEAARYSLLAGAPLEISHHGESTKLRTGKPVACSIPLLLPTNDVPRQPPGRAPLHRGPAEWRQPISEPKYGAHGGERASRQPG
jgi:alpha,alpha-trehalose phosphorylase